jgi:hypothetical protein
MFRQKEAALEVERKNAEQALVDNVVAGTRYPQANMSAVNR